MMKDLAKVIKQGNAIFDSKNHQKTFILAVNEYMLNFLQLCTSDDRSFNSLEKGYGRKHRYIAFMQHRYKKQDIELSNMEYKFITDLNTYLLVEHELKDISANK
ncbi:hypothetical protein [[Flexibacter] sp. ATCC 35208]|uniref:hypothetical protein n=1 Tax=[Flexibacter] sp. ATCC 35208 TaxID=1936242 RepID=UPI0009C7DF23|nr:hypothetical protein [[Flexibacter] sp. ATCC 35208]OMP74968.1 hypothetical protein BW716_32615 [[Flexibacter] sp. ATCC 35208]